MLQLVSPRLMTLLALRLSSNAPPLPPPNMRPQVLTRAWKWPSQLLCPKLAMLGRQACGGLSSEGCCFGGGLSESPAICCAAPALWAVAPSLCPPPWLLPPVGSSELQRKTLPLTIRMRGWAHVSRDNIEFIGRDKRLVECSPVS